MDLNYLYHRHQVSDFMSNNAASAGSRRAHRGLAEGYSAAIKAFRRGLAVPALAVGVSK